MVLSPTRTYAPVVKEILKKYHNNIHGMVHCSGGGQTKILHFIENLHVIKDNLFELPPLFRIIHEQSGTNFKEMYQVFNMGHRFEIYTDQSTAGKIIDIANDFNLGARIVGHCEKATSKQLTLKTPYGEFNY